MTVRKVAIPLATVILMAGCGASPAGEKAGEVDPQVLQDVISSTFMVPGPEVERARRVNAFILGMGITQCGGDPPPLDMTSDRMAQDLFPDLELIRRQGLTDEVDQRDLALETVGPDCEDLVPDVDTFEVWRDFYYDWTLLAEDTQARSDALAETKPEAVECLRRRTGLDVEDDDPTTFLRSSTYESSKTGDDREDEMRRAEAYADCMAEYFETMEEVLLKKRPEFVERHREVLERFASELSAAGYVP